MEIGKDKEVQVIESVVEWLKLTNLPTASQLDSGKKLGLEDAFKKTDGLYPDLIPQHVIDQAKRDISENRKGEKSILIPILEPTVIKKQNGGFAILPLFKEQVFSAVQNIVKLGLEIPKPEGVEGNGFIMVDNAKKKTILTTSGEVFQRIDTKDPHVFVDIGRKNSLDGPATNIKLSIQK